MRKLILKYSILDIDRKKNNQTKYFKITIHCYECVEIKMKK